jgi:hypothetical protein
MGGFKIYFFLLLKIKIVWGGIILILFEGVFKVHFRFNIKI